jgi:hypothetical protein
MATESQINANRANAQNSTGPSSPEGKLVSSHNALKTGLTGRTIVLPTDDIAEYQKLVALMHKKHSPEGDVEAHIVQFIADTEWRLLRIPTLEAGFYALGRHELAAECAHEADEQVRASMLNSLITRRYDKDLRNLALQERRLQSQLAKHVAELKQLQDDREAVLFHRRNEAMLNVLLKCKPFQPPANPADAIEQFGFVFSTDFLDTRRKVYDIADLDAVKQFDRSWKARFAKQAG